MIKGRFHSWTSFLLIKFREAPESIRALADFSALFARVCRVVKNCLFESSAKHSTNLQERTLVDAHAAAIDPNLFPILNPSLSPRLLL